MQENITKFFFLLTNYDKINMYYDSGGVMKSLKNNTFVRMSNTRQPNERQSNFELMRIVSMLFIILWHILMHGHVIENCENQALKTILQITQYIIVVHVNSFIILMGYFQSKSKFKLNKVIKLVLQVIFYSFVIMLIALKLGWIEDFSSITILNSLLPSGAMFDFWFIGAYITVYCFSNIINKFIDCLSKKDYQKTLLISFFFLSFLPFITGQGRFSNGGYNFYSFIFLYLIGGYLRRYPLNQSYHFKNLDKRKYVLLIIFIFFMCAYLNYSLTLFSSNINNKSNIFSFIANRINASNLFYSTPFVIVQTICYFELFRNMNIKNKYINYISKSVIGVYLIHENDYFRKNVYKLLGFEMKVYSYKFIIILMSAVLSIFIFCIIIDKLREKMFIVIKSIILFVKKNV